MATEKRDAATGTRRHVLEVKLETGDQLRVDAGGDLDAARAHLATIYTQIVSDPFVLVDENTVVRTEDIVYMQLRDESESGGTLARGAGTEGGNRVSTYGTERRTVTVRGGREDDEGRGYPEPLFGGGHTETRPFFLTSEFLTLVGSIAGVAIAMAVADNLEAPRGWLLITILAAAYMVSRGLAKSGTRSASGDPRDYR